MSENKIKYFPLMNEKRAKANKKIKTIQKNSLKQYGKGTKPVTKSKVGKLVSLRDAEKVEANADITLPTMDRKQLFALLTESGLTGMSGSDFKTIQKLEDFLENAPDTPILIVNGVECEPGLLHDEWLLENRAKEILAGIHILRKALGIDRCILASKLLAPIDCGEIENIKVPARYPMGEEHVLIRQLLGINLAKDLPPSQKGILVLNLQTVYQIYRLCAGRYSNGRYATLADLDTGDAVVAFLEYGSDIKDALISAFGPQAERNIYVGTGILHAHLLQAEETFQSGTCFAAFCSQDGIQEKKRCHHCGRCTRRCPMGVNVKKIVVAKEKDPAADTSEFGLDQCMHCGTCAYFCPAGNAVSEYLD